MRKFRNRTMILDNRLGHLVLLTVPSILLGLATGCNQSSPTTAPQSQLQAATEPVVRIVKPERKTVRHPIEQPGFNIEAFQETPLYAKISGYVTKWDPKYDIGQSVREGEVLCELYVPEMVVQLRQKEAAMGQSRAQIDQAKAALATAQAQVERSRSQFERLSKIGAAVDRESIDETRLGYQAAAAGVVKAEADVALAKAQLAVAQADHEFAQTMLQYARIRAPFNGVITQRHINNDDFVQPVGTGTKGLPLFVVDQLDPARVFVNVPGADAPWIRDGDPVSLRLEGAGGALLQGKVTRNARSLDPQSRTLRTEIDLPNPEGKLLPGMYVQATITVEHANVWTLPASALAAEGSQMICYRLENGKAVRTPLQVGLRGGGLVEVIKKQVKAVHAGEEGRWEPITGEDMIVANDPELLHDGQAVQVKLD
jgi:RND family efflux transporter MFP subunit